MRAIRSPLQMTGRAWWHALRDAGKLFRENNLGDRAAALTYYSVLSVFPGMIVLVSLLGVLGNADTVDALLRIVEDLGPQSAADTIGPALEKIVAETEAASVALVAGVLVALWSASGYIGALIRATNEIWEAEEDRPFWKLRPLQLAITLAMVLILAAILLAVVLAGPLADAIGNEIGVGDTGLFVWSIARWPAIFAVVVCVIALLYRISPDSNHQGLRWLLPASTLATLLWIAASAGFSLYVANFGSYANTYGSLAGAVVFLIWLWLTNLAILFGAQFGKELEWTAGAAASSHPPPVPLDPDERREPAGRGAQSAAPVTGTGSSGSDGTSANEGGASPSRSERRK